jgi:hypothetical protein
MPGKIATDCKEDDAERYAILQNSLLIRYSELLVNTFQHHQHIWKLIIEDF